MDLIKKNIDLRGDDYLWHRRFRQTWAFRLIQMIILVAFIFILSLLAKLYMSKLQAEVSELYILHEKLFEQTIPLRETENKLINLEALANLEKTIQSRSIPFSFTLEEISSGDVDSVLISRIFIFNHHVMEIEGICQEMKEAAQYRDYIANLSYTSSTELVTIASNGNNSFSFKIKTFLITENLENE